MKTIFPYRASVAGIGVLLSFLVLPGMLYAQDAGGSLSVTVTPPLFQLTISPGETWSSSVKVVNNNEYDVTYYASVVDFEAQGEEGKGELVPLIEEFDDPKKQTYSLASWVDISAEPITVPRGQSEDVPFTVHIPENAEPGGHYAAILVGTQPPTGATDGPSLRVSSFVSSLLFTKVSGEVIENGRIREFRTEQSVYEHPEAHFILRFENTGNTHLQPQGNISIYNMWGKERGEVSINQKSNFGNVLPESTRKFTFSWSADSGVFDIGRYSAVVTLAYGQEGKQNTSGTTYFWVVPTVPVVVTLGSIALFMLLITWFIRRYVRLALTLEKERAGISATTERAAHYSLEVLIEPIKEGVVDLRKLTKGAAPESPRVPISASHDDGIDFAQFLRKYTLFFAFLVMVVSALIIVSWTLRSAFAPSSAYEITDIAIGEEERQPGE